VRHPNPPDQTGSLGACTPELDIVVCGNPRRRVIRLDGVVDLATLAQFSAVLDQVLDECIGETAEDTPDAPRPGGASWCSISPSWDSCPCGLNEILRAQHALHVQDRRLVLADPAPAVRRLLAMLGLDESVTITPHRRAACCQRTGPTIPAEAGQA
jgi:hypothetical protein